ncbi:Biotin/lipoate A/B protein ligase [Entophlyctis sp. JEL0112]|nr:Biotin/lipoate A/B protein ligase [Entophlyctis sp. JEL0112]
MNYTCFMPRDMFSRDTSAQTVARALNHLDIPAEVNSRHDIVVEGRKVSGSAFKVVQARAYAHGTMLITSDLGELSALLRSPRRERMTGKGVESVPSEVTRLIDHSFTVTHTDFCCYVAETFGREFNGKSGLQDEIEELDMDDFDADPSIKEYYDEIRELDWKYRQTPAFADEFEKRFSWGTLKVRVSVTHGIITGMDLKSDKDVTKLSDAVKAFYIGMPYDDGTLHTWQLLNDVGRWRMSISGGEEVMVWIRDQIWSGIDESEWE